MHRESFDGPDWLLTDADADYFEFTVTLSAEIRTGRRIDANTSFALGQPGPGDLSDIEDGINAMLGRGTSFHHPPILAWGSLIDVLTAEGIPITEQQLIVTPLTVEFTAEVLAVFDHQ